MFLSRYLLRLVSCVIVFITICNSHKTQCGEDCKCHRRVDDGFFIRNYKPQPQQAQDVADKCIQIGDCSAAKNSKYREYDESCNNLKFPMWGVTNSAFVRLIPAKYSDGISKPRKAVDGSELPNAREVHTTVLKDKIIKDRKVSYLFSVFGQYISHDTIQTSQAATPTPSCCDNKKWPNKLGPNCTSSRIPEDDEFYSKVGVTCLPRVRALTTNDFGCSLEPRQQINPMTHFIDQSLVYGQTKEDAKKFKGAKGKLQISEIHNKIFPKANSNPQACDIRQGDKEICFTAGDDRVNQNPPLTTLVTVFIRFHNDFAEKLSKLNPKMPDEQVFEETRRVTIAVEHFIVRKEFLPLLIGPEFMAQAKLLYTNVNHDTIYDEFLNPSTLNEFTIAYRALHSTILDKLKLNHIEGSKSRNLVINDFINRPGFAVDNFDPLLNSVCKSPMSKQDKHGAFTMNNLFFRSTREYGGDLEMTSIERDREAGLAGYCDYMETLLNEPKITSWEDLRKYFSQQTIDDMKKVYKNFRDIDMYVGGVAECPVGNSMFGKLFTAIIADQFARWLIGDRHSPTLITGPGKFSKTQLLELNKISMAYLLCKYSDKVDSVPWRPFEISEESATVRNGNTSESRSNDIPESVSDEEEDEDRTLGIFLEEHQLEKPQFEKPSTIIRSLQIDCKFLPDIDLTPWKLLAD